jgi:hypothetical protein
MITKADFCLKTLPVSESSQFYYGSRDWANNVLVLCIEEVFNGERDLSARRLEVFYFLEELETYGFWWQVSRLRNWINLGVKKGVFTLSAESDPRGR